jgi:hypothetical protein
MPKGRVAASGLSLVSSGKNSRLNDEFQKQIKKGRSRQAQQGPAEKNLLNRCSGKPRRKHLPQASASEERQSPTLGATAANRGARSQLDCQRLGVYREGMSQPCGAHAPSGRDTAGGG